MTGIRVVAAKVAVFVIVTSILFVILANTMLNGLSGDKSEFKAEFADVSGLAVGDDVKAAGVRVGRVTDIEVTDDGAMVGFELIDEQKIYDTTRIIMRYQNLLGQRYLQLRQDGAAATSSRTAPRSRCSSTTARPGTGGGPARAST